MLDPDGVTLSVVPWSDPVGAQLRDEQTAEIRALYGPEGEEPGTPPSADDVVLFIVATDEDGEPVGCGGLRRLGPGVGEIKRMYVRPAARGRGVARRVLAELERRAAALGWSRLRLETGELQVAAVRLYVAAGYVRIDRFGEYAEAETSLCFERVLDAADR